MKVSDVKRAIKIIVLLPVIPVIWLMSRIMREILLSSGCHRCRAMIELGVEADMGYTARILRKYREEVK